MRDLYHDRLAGERLRRCYELASPRVQRYLRSEVAFVVSELRPGDVVLDLGCGYGRTMPDVARVARFVVGIDTSLVSLRLARERIAATSNAAVACMDATRLGFRVRSFDRVACVQNGIAAFHVDQERLVREALRVLRPEGVALFSTYSEEFWGPRLEWFERQAEAGLIAEIDRDRTGDGVIVCTDGSSFGSVRPERFRAVAATLGAAVDVVEVDASSVFFVVHA